MTQNTEFILITISLLLFLSVLAGRPSYKFGVPMLLFFLGVGIFAGSEGVLKIQFDNPEIAQFIGTVSLNFILFSGGLETRWDSVKPVLKEGITLSTLGVLITALSLGLFVNYITSLSLLESLLLGAIVSSTDAAAVFSILRSKNLALKHNLRSTLEFESGSNDPMANVLTITFLTLVQAPDQPISQLIIFFLMQLSIGAILGFLFAKLNIFIINKIQVSFQGLYPVLAIALMFGTYATTNLVGGNGFLAIYISSVILGNSCFVHKGDIVKMFDGLSWIMQITLFLTLGLLVFPSQVIEQAPLGLAISLFLIFIARPLSVFISTAPFKMPLVKRTFISWVGLRGAVPIVFATYPLMAGIQNANLIFNIVFFVSVSSILLQGTTLSLVASWLNIGMPEKENIENPADQILAEHPKAIMEKFVINAKNSTVGKKIIELNFPQNAIIAMIFRDNKYFTPSGSSKLEANDKLLVILDSQDEITKVKQSLSLI